MNPLVALAARILGRTPLGYIQLAHNPVRFMMAGAGVGFAVLLVFMQLGFMNMLFDSTVMMHRQLNADIVLINPAARDMINIRTFPRRKLVQALGVEGVADGEAMYVATVNWVKPTNGDRGPIFALGIRPDFNALRDPEVSLSMRSLTVPGTALFDRGSRGDFTSFSAKIDSGEVPRTEIAAKSIGFVGTFRMGSSFGAESTVVVSDQTFFALSPRSLPSTPNIGLLRVKAGYDPKDVARRIAALVEGPDVKVLTIDGFIQQSRAFLQRESPIAYIFTFGMIMGLFVGTVIVVQILATDVQEHLPEYATLKAIGFSNARLLSVVVEQSAILTAIGFVPGLLGALAGYALVRVGIAMPITMPPGRIALVFILTGVMCLIAGAVALRKVRRADPAEVF